MRVQQSASRSHPETESIQQSDQANDAFDTVLVPPIHPTAANIMALQRTLGNQAVQRMVRAFPKKTNSSMLIQRIILKRDGQPYKVLNTDTGTWSDLSAKEKLKLPALHEDTTKTYTIDEAKKQVKSGGTGGKMKKKKPPYSPYTRPPTADYSDSEEEEMKKGNAYTKKWGKKQGSKKVFNYTKLGQGAQKNKINNYVNDATLAAAIGKLATDAQTIHDIIPQKNADGETNRSYGATTVVTAIVGCESTGYYKKFVACNLELMGPSLRQQAEALGYHVIRAEQAHAEGELIQFLEARKNQYGSENMGVDKEHCVECNWALTLYLGSYGTQTGVSTKVFKNWYNPEPLQEALGQSDASTPHRHADGTRM
jgi:hypothetical protein